MALGVMILIRVNTPLLVVMLASLKGE